MKRFFVFLLAFLLCAGLCLPVFAVPQSAMIHTATNAARNAVGKDTPGAAVAVFEGGVRTLFEGYGYADITARTLVTAQTPFELGELSSLFVALAVQKLAEQGEAELDRDIAYYLPADFTKKLSLSHVITLRDLLTGGAGFAERKTDLRYDSVTLCFDSLGDALLACVPAQVNPPALYHTSSAFEIGLAAFVVESIAGQPYDDFVKEQILLPLGMQNTVLDPREQTEALATGHTCTQEGIFATAARGGRTYASLYPFDGAVSNLADLSLLLEFLLNDTVGTDVLSPASRDAVCAITAENGIFQVGAAALAVDGSARSLRASTTHFSAALCFDRTGGRGAVVLCNVAQSALLSLPDTLCGFARGVLPPTEGALYEAALFEGQYLRVSDGRGSLVGRGERNLHITLAEDGTLLFDGQRLLQVAPGFFADESGLAVVQFMLTVEGEVGELYTADGLCYRPAGFWEWDGVQSALFVLLMVGAFYFLAAGVIALIDAFLSRTNDEKRPRAWRFTLPWVLAAVHAFLTLLQAFAGVSVTTFYTATSVMALICTIGATAGFVWALLTAFTKHGMAGRVARSGLIYLLFLLVSAYFGVISF